jgi:hypothetical protein
MEYRGYLGTAPGSRAGLAATAQATPRLPINPFL